MGSIQYRKSADEQERRDRQEERDFERSFRLAEADADRESERQARIDRDRQFYGTQADRERDRLARMGVLPGADFGRDYRASMLPDVTPGISDTGGLAMQGLRQQGQAGGDELYGAVPDALNKLVAGKGVSEPLPGGGMVTMEPSVRASLMNAETSERVARENRNAEMARAQYRAEHPVARAENLEGRRVAFIAKRAGELMKPQTEIIGGLEFEKGPGLSSDASYGQAAEEWALVRGSPGEGAFTVVEGGSSSTAPTSRGFSGAGAHSAPEEPSMPQDEAMAQRWDELTGAGMSPEEATQRVLSEFE